MSNTTAFEIANAKSCACLDRSVDEFIKSWKYKKDSDEWKMIMLRKNFYEKKGLEYARLAELELEKICQKTQ